MWKPNTNEFEEPDQHWIHVELHKSQGPDLVGFDALKKKHAYIVQCGLYSKGFDKNPENPEMSDFCSENATCKTLIILLPTVFFWLMTMF